MKHFSLAEWVDFAREAAPQAQNDEMQQHLKGCNKCTQTLASWKTMVDFAQTEKLYQVPEASVHMARAMFVPRKLAQAKAGAMQIAKLIIDSFRSPLPMGVRSGANTSRYLGYKCDALAIDISLEPQGKQIALVGQLLNPELAAPTFTSAPVYLQTNKKTIAITTLNNSGEFRFVFMPYKDMTVVLKISPAFIAIPLPKKLLE